MSIYIILELILVALLVVSTYDFVRLYIYHDDDLVMRSVHNIILCAVLIVSTFLLYKTCYKTQSHKRFFLHVYLMIGIIAVIGIVNSAKRLDSIKK